MKKVKFNLAAFMFFIFIGFIGTAQTNTHIPEKDNQAMFAHNQDSFLKERTKGLILETSDITETSEHLTYLQKKNEVGVYENTNRIRKCTFESLFNLNYLISKKTSCCIAIPFGMNGNIRAVNNLGGGNMYSRKSMTYSMLDFNNGVNRGAFDLGVNFFDSERFRKISQLHGLNDISNNPYSLETLTANTKIEPLVINTELPSPTSTSKGEGTLSRIDQSGSTGTVAYNGNKQMGNRPHSRNKRKSSPAQKNISHRKAKHISHDIPERRNVSASIRSSINTSRSRSSTSSNTSRRIP